MDKSRTIGEWEQDYLRSQCESTDNVQYLAKVYGEIIGTASLNRKPRRMSHRGEFGISLKKAWRFKWHKMIIT